MQNDLESLIAFRNHLQRFNSTLIDEFARMREHWQSLGDVWTDAKYQEFGQALQEAANGIQHYLHSTANHEESLLRTIRILEAYLENRMG
jgi:hypothetical protein